LRAEDEVHAGGGPGGLAGLAVEALEAVLVLGGSPLVLHVQQVDEEVVGQRADAVGEDAFAAAIRIGAQYTHAADQHGHFRRAQAQQMRLVDQRFLGSHEVRLVIVVAKAIGDRAQRFEGLCVGPLLLGIHAPWREGHGDVHATVLRGLLDRRAAGKHDQVRHGDLLAAGGRAVEVVLDLAELVQHLLQQRRVVDLPVLLRREADACAVGAATLVRSAIGGGRCPGY